SATDTEAKSKGTPPDSRTAAQASRAKSPRSALHGVTRPSVDATPTKGFFKSISVKPKARRNARCGARSSPSTVMRDGSFFVFTYDFLDVAAVRQAEPRRALGSGAFRHRVHDGLERGIGLEPDLGLHLGFHPVPHLQSEYRNPGEQHRALMSDAFRRNFASE